ncbi:MAG: hypothetical protein ACRDTQ_15750 [Micromonosporaceae bacterium]
MTTTDQIFFHADLTPEQAAQAIADALGCDLEMIEGGAYLGRSHVAGLTDYVAGPVSDNYLAEPDGEILAGYDRYPLMWEMVKKGVPDWVRQKTAARALFDEMTAKLGWPALLTHENEIAIADFSPERGLRVFDEDTPVDAAIVIQ